MPYVKKAVAEKVILSDPTYFVMWRPSINYGALRDAATAATKISPSGEAETDNGLAADNLILAHIESWNLDDEEGKPLPLTPTSLRLLDETDANTLGELLSAQSKVQAKSRKNS